MYYVSLLIRNILAYGTWAKELKVEVYLSPYKLCVYPNTDDIRMHSFSQADSVGKYNGDTIRFTYI